MLPELSIFPENTENYTCITYPLTSTHYGGRKFSKKTPDDLCILTKMGAVKGCSEQSEKRDI